MKVYFDLDNTLADFDRGLIELCGTEPVHQDKSTKEEDDNMWKCIRETEHFYDRLELKAGAKELFDLAYNALGDDCQILSAPPKANRGIVTATEDKIAWSHRMLSPDLIVNIVYKEEKPKFCTGKDCILIDDMAENIEAWKKYDGIGILCTDTTEAKEKLKEYLK